MNNPSLAISETLYFLTTKIHTSPQGILFLYPNQKLEDGLDKHLNDTEFKLSPAQQDKVFRSCYYHLTGKENYIEFSPDSADFLKLPAPPSGFYNTANQNGNWHPEHRVHNPPKNQKGEWPTMSMRLRNKYHTTLLPNHIEPIMKILDGYKVF